MLIHSWRLFEADPTIAGVLVVAFAGLAVAYLVMRMMKSRKGRK